MMTCHENFAYTHVTIWDTVLLSFITLEHDLVYSFTGNINFSSKLEKYDLYY